MKYYLINNTIKKGSEMPNSLAYDHPNQYRGDRAIWGNSLQPCEISESELEKIEMYLTKNMSMYMNSSNLIDITDIVSDNNGVITFKHPKQVEKENEAVEFYKWTATLTPTSNENCFNKIRDGYYRIKPPMELYEIFKNR